MIWVISPLLLLFFYIYIYILKPGYFRDVFEPGNGSNGWLKLCLGQGLVCGYWRTRGKHPGAFLQKFKIEYGVLDRGCEVGIHVTDREKYIFSFIGKSLVEIFRNKHMKINVYPSVEVKDNLLRSFVHQVFGCDLFSNF